MYNLGRSVLVIPWEYASEGLPAAVPAAVTLRQKAAILNNTDFLLSDIDR